MSPQETRTTWQSVKTLFSPQTIPMLRAQGVVPKLFPVMTLLMGMVLGFLWAYVISPNVYLGAGPVHLGQDFKKEWIKLVATQFAASNADDASATNAKNQLDRLGDAGDVLAVMLKENASDPILEQKLQALQDKGLAVNNPSALQLVTPTLFNSNLTPILCVVTLGILVSLAVIVNTIIPVGTILFSRKSTDPSTVPQGLDKDRRLKELRAVEDAKALAVAEPPPPVTANLGEPVGKYVSTYLMGDDHYDDSFAIETEANEFLGETGAGISKTIGVGDPQKVTAVEVWVFDKNDIRTLTKVLMSEYAFNDEGIKAELAPKGEAILLRPGGVVILETQTLIIQARVINLTYGTGSLPPNSFFDQVSIEISAWPKKASTPTGTPVIQTSAAQPQMPPAPSPTQLPPAPQPTKLPPAPLAQQTPVAPPPTQLPRLSPQPPASTQSPPPPPPTMPDAFGDTSTTKKV